MATIGSLVVKIGADIAGLEAGLDTAAGKLKGFGKSSAQLGGALTAGVTLPLVGIGVMALKSAGEFESGMNVLQSITSASTKDMEAMSAEALRLGAETSFSAGEAAAGMLELGKAGLVPRDIIASMPGVLSLAAAGNLDVATAAGIAANAVNTFGLEAGETTNVANMLAAAANASSADVTDLAQGFTMAGSVFAANHQSMSDLTTSMSLLSNAGIQGSDAGTSLKTMLMRLTAPTGEAADVLDQLGLNVYNADGSMRDFQSIVGDLSTATKGLTDVQRNAALSTLFGADAIRAANVLVGEGAQGFADMEAAVNKAGAAEEAAGARMKGFDGAMEGLKGSIDSLLIKIGTPFLGALTGITQALTEMVNGFMNLPSGVQTAIVVLLGVAAAAGPVLVAIGAMASGVGALMPVIAAVGAVVGAISAPVLAVVAVVAALGAAWATNFMGIRDITMAVFNAVVGPIQNFIAVVQDAGWGSIEAAEALTLLPAPLQAIIGFFDGIISPIQNFIAVVQDAGWGSIEAAEALTLLPAPVQAIIGFFDGIISPIQNFIAVVQDAGWGSIEAAEALTLLPAPLQAIIGFFDGIISPIQNFIAVVQDAGWGSIEAAEALTLLPAPLQAIIGALQKAVGAISSAFSSMLAAVQPALAKIGAAFGQLWTTAQPALMAFGEMVGQALMAIGQVAAAVLGVGLIVALNTLVAAFQTAAAVVVALITHISTTLTYISTTFQNVVLLIQALLAGDWATAWELAKTIVGDTVTYWQTTLGTIVTLAQEIMLNFVSIITQSLKDMGVNVEGILGALNGFWTGIWQTMADAVQPVMDAIKTLQDGIQAFKDWLSGSSMPNPFAGLDVPVPQSNFALPPGGIALPQLPGFAEGTSNYPGGWGIVGEEGPELVKLPRGSEILPADASAAMGGGVTVYANVNGKVDVEELAQRVLDVLRRRGR
jgi:TP901 family phage tail tape measure protein